MKALMGALGGIASVLHMTSSSSCVTGTLSGRQEILAEARTEACRGAGPGAWTVLRGLEGALAWDPESPSSRLSLCTRCGLGKSQSLSGRQRPPSGMEIPEASSLGRPGGEPDTCRLLGGPLLLLLRRPLLPAASRGPSCRPPGLSGLPPSAPSSSCPPSSQHPPPCDPPGRTDITSNRKMPVWIAWTPPPAANRSCSGSPGTQRNILKPGVTASRPLRGLRESLPARARL